jgi:hypothetical protein
MHISVLVSCSGVGRLTRFTLSGSNEALHDGGRLWIHARIMITIAWKYLGIHARIVILIAWEYHIFTGAR